MSGTIVADVLKFVQDWSAFGIAGAALIVLLAGKGPLTALGVWRDAVASAIAYPFLAGVRAEKLSRAIMAEVRPNGGSSLRDAITRIEEFQVRMGGRVDLVMLAMDQAAAVYETDPDGHCYWASPAYQQITGRSLAELNGWGWSVVIYPEDTDRVRVEWERSVLDRRSFNMKFRMIHADGHVFSVHSVASPLWIGEGLNARIIGWSGLVTVEDE